MVPVPVIVRPKICWGWRVGMLYPREEPRSRLLSLEGCSLSRVLIVRVLLLRICAHMRLADHPLLVAQ